MATFQEIRERLERETPEVRPEPSVNSHREEPTVQVSNKPVRKVSASALTGAVIAIGIFLTDQYGVMVTPEVASALTLVLMTIVGYVVPMSENDKLR